MIIEGQKLIIEMMIYVTLVLCQILAVSKKILLLVWETSRQTWVQFWVRNKVHKGMYSVVIEGYIVSMRGDAPNLAQRTKSEENPKP